MLKKLKYFIRYILIPDKIYIKYKFNKYLNYKLNLENPKSFNEKIQWLKLFDRTPLHTKCADKYLVREYVAKKIGKEFLIPLIFTTNNAKDICIKKLPEFPVITKPNHSHGAYIINNKYSNDLKSIQKKLRKELKNNFYYRTREWQYKNIKPLIVVEKLLMDGKGKIPDDYKFFCMNGNVKLIQVDCDRFNNHTRSLYNKAWEKQNFELHFPKGNDIKKPKLLNKMIEIAQKLSRDFIFVRVDLYIINDKIYFGELTFHPGSGFEQFKPQKVDFKLGEELSLKT